jgi:acyl dehydratase
MTSDETKLSELGDELGPLQRRAPGAAEIRRYASSEGTREGIFSDEEYARGLGFRGLVVPGPVLAAYVEQFLHAELPQWRVVWLSTTFRLPTAAGDLLSLRGAVTEDHHMSDGEHLVCDVVVEHASGECAVTASARLVRL